MGLFAKTLDTYDYVFSHDFLDGHVRGGGSEELCRRLPKTMIFPAITFAAFHPDLVYIHDLSRMHGFVCGPIGPYHSAIALFAYRKGLSVEMANALFNENVFDALGYFDMWNAASRELLDGTLQRFGLDLSAELMNWSRRGVFMYSTVHPMSFVLFDLSRKLFETVGLKPRTVNFNYYAIHDLARSEIFPIYPPIAKRYGAQGGYMLKLQNDPSQLSNARVDAWLADEATSGLLMRLARENFVAGLTPTL